MSGFMDAFFIGLGNGAVYAMVAVGLVVIYRASGLLNFAQGEMAMFTAYFVWMFYEAGLPLWLATIAAAACGFVMGSVTYQLLVRPVGSTKDNPLAVVIVTIGMFLGFLALAPLIWGTNNQMIDSFVDGDVNLLGGTLSWQKALAIVLLAAQSLALFLIFKKTKLGLAMRAVASNAESAALCGINVSRVLMITWGLAAAIGAIAGTLWATNTKAVSPGLMALVLIYAFAAITLGGFDSVIGAVVGGILIGLITDLVPKYVGIFDGMPLAPALIIMLIVLLVRPQGLFGTKKVSRV